jgi:transposase
VHTEPGEEMQVDFGAVGPLFDPAAGCPRSAYVFVATLGFSRHQYTELVFDQKTPTWIALHRRTFESFGGVPVRVVPDNLKPAVKQILVQDPVLGEAYRRMALHYGFLVSPTLPAMPQHYPEFGITSTKARWKMASTMSSAISWRDKNSWTCSSPINA